jgi:thymidine phosphorylase
VIAPAETIRAKRDGERLSDAQIADFVTGLVSRRWSEGQAAALAMAIVLRGMDAGETVALTRAMAQSGTVLDWSHAQLPGPVLDKHSTGGVGDKVSLLLAPIVAACGGVVPMVSGRGLGHTGGTLDKLEALPGYTVQPRRSTLTRVLREAGCAIVGASARIAPADRRLYAIRDVTATVESVPLITASILSKKLAAGLSALVMDVKVGNGAFCRTLDEARTLADTITQVARGAGLPTRALITDMNQVLGRSAGNALEVQEAIDVLVGRAADPRLLAVTLALAAELLQLGGLARTLADGEAMARDALASGRAAERFERMVAGLGGPTSVLKRPMLPKARWRVAVHAAENGFVERMDTRALGLAVITLGGGRLRPGDGVDPRVGLAEVLPRGTRVAVGDALAVVHAAKLADAEAVAKQVAAAIRIGAGDPLHDPPAVVE